MSLGVLFFINLIKIKIITAMVIFVINITFFILWMFVNTIRKSIRNESWAPETDERPNKDLDTVDDLEEWRSETHNDCSSIKSY